ncbi:MAG TPA: glycosyltransferase family 4 protein [Vicinamibacterales bacterium]|nr:glycosyltransferase family 4 protein [Vicinamibacterales bacterium]
MLLVAGAYFPEISAAGLQCRAAAAALGDRVRFSVLVTSVDSSLPVTEVIDGVTVHRLSIDVRSGASKAGASLRIVTKLMSILPGIDVVHLHGFSQKNVPVTVMARTMGKPVVLTLHTSGQDEPQAADARGRLAGWAFRAARLILPVSPNLARRCEEAGVPAAKVRLTPNGIDVDRFRPADAVERAALRREIGWAGADRVVVFVGFFSHDKRPDLLFRAWKRTVKQGIAAKLVYIGATASPYYEIDRAIAQDIGDEAAATGHASDVVFVDPTHAIERYYRAADAFVLSSIREANPVSLLEAMACGLPCIASRIEGATDVILEDRVNGRLVERDDEAGLAGALADVLADPDAASRLGRAARTTIVNRYDIRQTADRWLHAYDDSIR